MLPDVGIDVMEPDIMSNILFVHPTDNELSRKTFGTLGVIVLDYYMPSDLVVLTCL